MVVMISAVVLSIVYLTKRDVQAKIVTTIFPIYDICREIMGSDDEILLLESNGSDMHSYNPTASDIATIASAELFIYIGGKSDEWISDVIRTTNSVNLETISLMDIEKMTKLAESTDNIIEPDHDHEHDHEEGEVLDEHIWLSIKNAIVMTTAIRDGLIKVFPEKQELFKQNATEYISKLQNLHNDYTSSIANKSDTIIIAYRFPFRYLVHDYNINYFAIFSGCSAETEASTETIATLIDKINETAVDYILVLETTDQSIAHSVINNANTKEGLEILVINSCQTVSQSTMQSVSYLQIMAENLEILKKVISHENFGV